MNVDLRETLRYVPKFAGETFVICLQDKLQASTEMTEVISDIALLNSLGIRLVLTFDPTQLAQKLATERGYQGTIGQRGEPIDSEQIGWIQDATLKIIATLAQELTMADLKYACGNLLNLRPKGVVKGTDQQHAGVVAEVESHLAELLLDGVIPLVSPVGFSNQGRLLSVPVEVVAAEAAMSLKASKIVQVISSGSPLLQLEPRAVKPDEVAPELPAPEKFWVAEGVRACEAGVSRVHFVGGSSDNDPILNELFSTEGAGFMIHSDTYKHIRRAIPGDVDEICLFYLATENPSALQQRTREEVLKNVDNFWVLEVDQNMAAIAALQPYMVQDQAIAEIVNVGVKTSHRGVGYGSAIVNHLEKQARKLGFPYIFVCSTQTVEFFEKKHGFKECEDLALIPEARKEKILASGRNSKVLIKYLST